LILEKLKELDGLRIAVIGQGYVGLPLAVEFAKKFSTIGFDINSNRVLSLQNGHDSTLEVSDEELQSVLLVKPNIHFTEHGLYISDAESDISACNVFIVTVPTPIDQFKAPDLRPLKKASQMIAGILKVGDYVIYESTTFPGCTEEVCVPILEESGLRFNHDFYVGYSPERINPGDRLHTVRTIKKVTSGSTPSAAQFVDQLYQKIVDAGTHLAPSIKVAEASKVIENAQRDVNISFVNELSVIFERMGIDTIDVLEAASTKWNFLPFRPGLVGGHCISVDPYYLSHKAESIGYHPAVILSGRRVNDGMGAFVAKRLVKIMIKKGLNISDSNILICGFTFKENCPDYRNTKVVDIRKELIEFGCNVDILDPWVDQKEVFNEYGFVVLNDLNLDLKKYQGIVLAVAHEQFKELKITKKSNQAVFDVKGVLQQTNSDARL
jgi:UDP-N-acetyl-D-galactosamine dehydrogenase